MNRTKIEWVRNPDGSQGYTLNSKTGCENHTPEGLCLGGLFPCYAFKLAHGRLEKRYLANPDLAELWGSINIFDNIFDKADRELEYDRHSTDPFYPRFWAQRLEQPSRIKKLIGIFLDDMSDWMGDYWPRLCTERELAVMRENPQHRFYTLTKQPQNLIKFSPFPDNCWVGVTATNSILYATAAYWLKEIEAKVKFISFEPLLERIAPKAWPWQLFPEGNPKGICNWLIIGAQTKPYKPPEIAWVREIVEAADRAGIPVFLKDNLKPLLENDPLNRLYWANAFDDERGNERADDELRQELPE